MTSEQYAAHFKAEAIKQVTERGNPVFEVAQWLGGRHLRLRGQGVSRNACEPQQGADLQKEISCW